MQQINGKTSLFLLSYVGEWPWWPIQSLNNGRKKKAKGLEEREIRSSLLILDFNLVNLEFYPSTSPLLEPFNFVPGLRNRALLFIFSSDSKQ